MARAAGRVKSTKRAARAAGSAGEVPTRKPPARAPRPAQLVEAIAHEIFQTRAAYRADLFAHEHDEALIK
jgi:hypothetical protein